MKVEFLTNLDVRRLWKGCDWKLLAPFVALIDGERLEVPAGFVTDFASVPRLPLAFLLAGDTGHRAATLHDWLYSTMHFPREKCDEIFRAALEAEGIGAFTRSLMHAGVRLGGASHFGQSQVQE